MVPSVPGEPPPDGSGHMPGGPSPSAGGHATIGGDLFVTTEDANSIVLLGGGLTIAGESDPDLILQHHVNVNVDDPGFPETDIAPFAELTRSIIDSNTDLAGGDIGWATRKRRAATRNPKARYVEVADRVCERGWFGQKTGRGFYLYPQGARVGQPDPEVLAIVDAERAKKGVTPRQFTPEEIMRRYMAAMVNEGAKVVEEGIALRPLDVDVTFLSGYGFPRFRGGPMKWADMQGLDKVLADIREFAKEDALFWKPAPLLEKLVAEGRDFESLNKAA